MFKSSLSGIIHIFFIKVLDNVNDNCYYYRMKEQRYSKHRELIKDFLTGNTSHPTADEVYLHLRELHPDISLATVYRNLRQLSESGEVRCIDVGDGKDRFDYNINEHAHFLCTVCGKVCDVFYSTDKVRAALSGIPGNIETAEFYFHGTCNACMARKAAYKVN